MLFSYNKTFHTKLASCKETYKLEGCLERGLVTQKMLSDWINVTIHSFVCNKIVFMYLNIKKGEVLVEL